jgi:hypothetical protein
MKQRVHAPVVRRSCRGHVGEPRQQRVPRSRPRGYNVGVIITRRNTIGVTIPRRNTVGVTITRRNASGLSTPRHNTLGVSTPRVRMSVPADRCAFARGTPELHSKGFRRSSLHRQPESQRVGELFCVLPGQPAQVC